MKAIIATLIIAAGLTAQASESTVYWIQGQKSTSKTEALKALIKSDNQAEVYECKLKEVSKKATLKNKE